MGINYGSNSNLSNNSSVSNKIILDAFEELPSHEKDKSDNI